MLDQLNDFLLRQKEAGRRVLLIVDEAQNLDIATLEEVRLLSNLETSSSKLIQILLFGQPELDDKIESNELRQLRQRISVRWQLHALSASETREYVSHRLRIARGGPCQIFTERALREVHRWAGGVPRLVNLLADRSLLAGYASGEETVSPELVERAAREILLARRRRLRKRWPWRRGAAAAGLAGALALGAWFLAREAAQPLASADPPPVSARALEPASFELSDPADLPPPAALRDAGATADMVGPRAIPVRGDAG